MKTRKCFFCSVFTFLVCAFCSAFSYENIISPAVGEWANKQALVLDLTDDVDVYYSLTGTDPMVSGFAYDGPVIIDEAGVVHLRLAVYSKTDYSAPRQDFTVIYSVVSDSYVEREEKTHSFLSSLKFNPIKRYVSGDDFSVPAGFKYALSNSEPPYWNKVFHLSSRNKVDRYVPVSMSDGLSRYHFVLHVVPSEKKNLADADVPFRIDDWSKFSFAGEKLIYQIDDNYWSADRKPVELDRSVSHIIRWRSFDFDTENPVYEFELPPKPTIYSRQCTDGTVNFHIKGNDLYSFGFDGNTSADAFFGEHLNTKATFMIYCKGIPQGRLAASYEIDRRPPSPPIISSTSLTGYARNEVTMNIWSEDKDRVFYAVSRPYESPDGFSDLNASVFDTIPPGKYVEYDGKDFVLSTISDKAVFYKINAYSVDSWGNKSSISEHHVVIDEINYYIGRNSHAEKYSKLMDEPDGTFANPFVTLDQALEVVNKLKSVRLHVTGTIEVSGGTKTFLSDCEIFGNNGTLLFDEESNICVKSCSVSVENCIIRKKDGNGLSSRLIILDKAGLTLNNCEVAGIFRKDGVVLEGENSRLNLKDCGVTVQSGDYGCTLSFVDSSVNIADCHITTVASTCVGLSVNGGQCSADRNSFSLIGGIGRGVELIKTRAGIFDNSFVADFSDSRQNVEIWKDVNTVLESKNNSSKGF